MNETYTPEDNPQQRATDRGVLSVLRHNALWLWLIAITGLVFLALWSIQNSRYQQCEGLNKRHDNAIAALKAGSDQDIANAQTPAMKIEIARRRDVTITLIDAVAPTQDCDSLVSQAWLY